MTFGLCRQLVARVTKVPPLLVAEIHCKEMLVLADGSLFSLVFNTVFIPSSARSTVLKCVNRNGATITAYSERNKVHISGQSANTLPLHADF